MKLTYNCKKCTGFCCSYEDIPVERHELKAIAEHFQLPYNVARAKYTTKSTDDGRTVFRHKKDTIFKSVCQFLDTKTRKCTIYQVRPSVCRTYPEAPRCGYYEMLSSERKRQQDPTIQIRVDW